MGLIKYSEHDLRGLLSRVIHARWPAEELLVLTPCQKVSEGPGHLPPELEPQVSIPPSGPQLAPERGFLAATQSRLIFQEEVTSGLLLRSISVIVAVLAVAVLFFGNGVGTFLPMATMALGLWGIAKVLEMMVVARTDIEFDRVGILDPFTQRIEAMGSNGTRYHLGVPDPSDFQLVAALVAG
jgi:hypothetical protein